MSLAHQNFNYIKAKQRNMKWKVIDRKHYMQDDENKRLNHSMYYCTCDISYLEYRKCNIETQAISNNNGMDYVYDNGPMFMLEANV